MNMTKVREYGKWMFVAAVSLFVILQAPLPAFAQRGSGGHSGGFHGVGEGRGHINPPGPAGGPGRGQGWRDNDNNPPGPRGGQGTNWERQDFQNHRENFNKFLENHPKVEQKMDRNHDGKIGPVERKIAREKLRDKYGNDKDNNPPGPAGGPGTNWENKPGPQGGPGASPDYQKPRPRQRLDALKERRDKMAANGAPAEKLQKVDEKIQALQTKIDQYQSTQNTATETH